jgi:hypothetical protein
MFPFNSTRCRALIGDRMKIRSEMETLLRQRDNRGSLEWTIATFSRQQCSNPHDRIYALLGLTAPFLPKIIEVDYGRTTVQLLSYILEMHSMIYPLYGPTIAQAIGLPPSDANMVLPEQLLSKLVRGRFASSHPCVGPNKRLGTSISYKTAGGNLFVPKLQSQLLPDFAMEYIALRKCPNCVADESSTPQVGDILVNIDGLDLKVVCRLRNPAQVDLRGMGSNIPIEVVCRADAQGAATNDGMDCILYCPLEDRVRAALGSQILGPGWMVTLGRS